MLATYVRAAAEAMVIRQRVVGERIREARKRKQLRQKDLAARVDVDPQTISNWERGENSPTFENIEALARALGRSVSYLLDEPEEVVDVPPAFATLSEVAARLEAAADRVAEEAAGLGKVAERLADLLAAQEEVAVRLESVLDALVRREVQGERG